MRNFLRHAGLVVTLCLAACASTDNPQSVVKVVDSDGKPIDIPYANIAMPGKSLSPTQRLTRIGFGSCLQQWGDMWIWDMIAAENPDLFVFLGDNVYGDAYPDKPEFNDPALPKLVAAYAKLSDSDVFERFRKSTPMLVTWDDHDYGLNDGGANFQFKDRAKDLFLEAWDVPKSDPRRSHPGVYSSETIGPRGERVQLILLDTRYFRGPMVKSDEYGAKGKERYVPDLNSDATMLGAAQWAWLESELRKPAELRVIVSSIQVIADGHGWEAWKMMPKERDHLYEVIKNAGATNTVLVSGDRHAGAMYQRDNVVGFPLLELSTSSLNAPVSKWKKAEDTYVEPGPHRLTDMQEEVNYGMIDIDWHTRKAVMRLVAPGREVWTEAFSFKNGVISK